MKFIKAFVALTGLAAIYGQAPIANAQIDIGKTGTANSTGSWTAPEKVVHLLS